MANCTLRQTHSDILWERTQGRQTRFIEAQETGRAKAEKIAGIRAHYTFTLYDFRTFYQGGVCIQSSMLVENPADVNDRYIVTCSVETGEEVWTVQTPSFRKDLGPLFIAAVQSRISANRAKKAVN